MLLIALSHTKFLSLFRYEIARGLFQCYILNALLFFLLRTRPSLRLVRLHAPLFFFNLKLLTRACLKPYLFIWANSCFSTTTACSQVFRLATVLQNLYSENVHSSSYVCVYFPTTNTLTRREKVAVGIFVHCFRLTALAF